MVRLRRSESPAEVKMPMLIKDDLWTHFERSDSKLSLPRIESGYKECFACKKPIFDFIESQCAMGKRWHNHCFHCARCRKELTSDRFYEKDGKPYCQADFEDLFLPKCFTCTKTIYDTSPVKVLNRIYHPLCFTCRKCSQVVCPYNFHEWKGSPYCEFDFHDLFSPKCYTCHEPIKDQKHMTKALGTTFHPEHFVCFQCAKPLPGNNFRKRDGELYCEDDYHKLFSPKCAECAEPIRHEGIRALGKEFHKNCCLRCAACDKILKEDNWIQQNDKAYCKADWVRNFAPRCGGCKGAVAEVLNGESVIAIGQDWHPQCFVCEDCNRLLDERTYYEVHGMAYCQEHFHDRTCPDCLKAKAERKKQHAKILSNGRSRSVQRETRRSLSPIDVLFRPKSSLF